jgi:hypothetical protein
LFHGAHRTAQPEEILKKAIATFASGEFEFTYSERALAQSG